ncbi:MAG: hypothetical protein PWQ62_294 [Candidatus Methanomethylophilaceae archaeon]|nr:hypothetical protein [Candidatus Methanomethylophilaceae archaeon]
MANIGFFKSCLNKLDLISALIGLILGMVILILSISRIINQSFIGYTIFSISLIYVLIRPKVRYQEAVSPLSLSPRALTLLNIAFWSLLSVVLLIWHSNTYYRPTPYFLIISILSVIIALEIFSSRNSNRFLWIFVKIVILSLVIRGGIFFNYPSIMGYDAYAHTNIAELIMLKGSIPPIDISGKYFYSPILHVFIANVGILCQIPVKDAVFFSIGIGSVISTFFIIIIGKRIAGLQVGLLAALFANITNDLIIAGIANITPGSLVLCYLLVMLYLVLASNIRPMVRDSLLIFLSLLLVITHQLSTFVVFLIMLALYLSQALRSHYHGTKVRITPTTSYLALFGIAILSYWIIMELPNGTSFFEYVAKPFITVLSEGGQYGSDLLVVGHQYDRAFFDLLIHQASYLILPFFAIGGLFLFMSPKGKGEFSIAFVATALLLFVYGVPLLGIRNLLTSRWMPILCIFLCILAATFIWRLINLSSSRSRRICAVILIVFIFAFLMITTPAINRDNPLVGKDTTVRNQFTYSELQAVRTIGSLSAGDTYVDRTFQNAYIHYHPYDMSSEGTVLPNQVFGFDKSPDDNRIGANTLFVLRICTLYEPISVKASNLFGDLISQTLPQSFFDSFESGDYNKIYANKYVISYSPI